jgi:hypothetical protein
VSALILAGIEIPVRAGTMRELPPELAGGERPRFDNSLGDTGRSPRRVFTCEAWFPPNDTKVDTLRTAISVAGALGVPTSVLAESSVDGLTRGESLLVRVRMGEIRSVTTYVATVKTVYWVVPLTLKEASPFGTFIL